MLNPEKVIAFLDVTGEWDPSLAFVMGGALVTTFIGYKFVAKKEPPLFEGSFKRLSHKDIDARLVIGAVLFGTVWELSGLCPGPAIANVGFDGTIAPIFLGAMGKEASLRASSENLKPIRGFDAKPSLCTRSKETPAKFRSRNDFF